MLCQGTVLCQGMYQVLRSYAHGSQGAMSRRFLQGDVPRVLSSGTLSSVCYPRVLASRCYP